MSGAQRSRDPCRPGKEGRELPGLRRVRNCTRTESEPSRRFSEKLGVVGGKLPVGIRLSGGESQGIATFVEEIRLEFMDRFSPCPIGLGTAVRCHNARC